MRRLKPSDLTECAFEVASYIASSQIGDVRGLGR